MENVLVFAPHPDDDVIGCGGSIAKHIHQGDGVAIVYMTSGEAGSLEYPAPKLRRLREIEARNSSVLLGVTDLTFLRHPDGYLEYTRTALDAVVSLIRCKQPTRIYIPHNHDSIPDHKVTHHLVMEASRRAGGPWFRQCGTESWKVRTVLGYEVSTPLVSVGYSQDISAYLPKKLEALRLHRSQLDSIPYDQAIQALNRYRGIMTGQGKYCECFQLLRALI
jgi:LmbE family N-acetylglucosaminyl deacetylase